MTTHAGPIVEICVSDLDGALAAEHAGADRIEICADLGQGGTTPSIGLVGTALDELRRVAVRVMIRPRGGDFLVDDAQLRVALADIAAIRALPNPHGLDLGFVFGAVEGSPEERRLDLPTLRRLGDACGPHEVTVHRAFDEAADLDAALEDAVSLGATRVLTSGAAATALEGAATITRLRERAGDRIGILACGGIRPDNVAAVLAATGATEIHLRAPVLRHGTEATDEALIEELLREVRG